MNFEPVFASQRFVLGEGPHFDRETGHLYWVDIVPGEAWRLDTGSGALRHWSFGTLISAVVPRASGGLMVALKNELVFFDPATGARTPFAAPEQHHQANRSNEARVDPTGRFWLGTMQNTTGPNGEDLPCTANVGALYRVEADGRFDEVVSEVGISNTLAWDEQRGRMYFGDSVSETIRVWDWDQANGSIANPRMFAAPNAHGVPDGSALDAEGYLWNCRWGGSCILRYAPDGRIDRVVPVPVTNPTSCVFGGPDLRTLYVTSARSGLSPEQLAKNPLEGALLSARADVAGQACTRLAA